MREAEANADELRLARAELQRARQRAAELSEAYATTSAEADRMRGQLLDSWTQVKNMRATLSWRVTAPLRAAKRMRSQ